MAVFISFEAGVAAQIAVKPYGRCRAFRNPFAFHRPKFLRFEYDFSFFLVHLRRATKRQETVPHRSKHTCLSHSLNTPLLIVPNSIHPEPGLLDIQMRHPAQKFVLPPVNLHKPNLIIAHCEPLVAPRTRAHSVAMPATGRRRIQANLPLDHACLAELEGRNVAREFGRVGARGREEVFA